MVSQYEKAQLCVSALVGATAAISALLRAGARQRLSSTRHLGASLHVRVLAGCASRRFRERSTSYGLRMSCCRRAVHQAPTLAVRPPTLSATVVVLRRRSGAQHRCEQAAAVAASRSRCCHRMLSSSSTIRGRGGCGTRRARASHRFRTPPLGCIETAASPCAHDQSKRSKGAWYTCDEYVQRFARRYGMPDNHFLSVRGSYSKWQCIHFPLRCLPASLLMKRGHTYAFIHATAPAQRLPSALSLHLI